MIVFLLADRKGNKYHRDKYWDKKSEAQVANRKEEERKKSKADWARANRKKKKDQTQAETPAKQEAEAKAPPPKSVLKMKKGVMLSSFLGSKDPPGPNDPPAASPPRSCHHRSGSGQLP